MIQRVAQWCADVSVRRRWPILIATALLVGACAYPAIFVPYDASYEIWFLEDDPAVVSYARFHDLFGNDETLLLSLDTGPEGVFRNEVLQSIGRATEFFDRNPSIRRVLSLSRYEAIHGTADDIELIPAVSHLPMTPEELAATRARVMADTMAVTSVVNRDGTMAVVIGEIVHMPHEFRHRAQLLDDVRGFIAEEKARSGLEYRLSGGAVLDEYIYRMTRRDFHRSIPLVTLLIALVLVYTVRSVAGVILPLAVILSSVVLARAATPLLGWRDNSMLTIVPLIVMAIGVADSVHIVVHYLRLRGAGRDGPAAARETIVRLFKPCLLTSATTMIGFLALLTASLAPLRQLGVLTSIGVAAAFLLSVFTLPAALSLLRGNYERCSARLEAGFFPRTLVRIPGFARRFRWGILAAAAALTVLGAVGLTRVQVETNAIEFLRDGDPFRVQAQELQRKIGGIGSLEIVVHAKEEGGIRDPEVLRAMDALAVYAADQPLVYSAHSVADYLKTVNRAMNEDDPAAYRIPDSSELAAQYLLLYDASSPAVGLDRLVDLTHTHARIWARTGFGSSTAYKALQDSVSAFAARTFPDDVDMEYTGVVTLYKNMGDYITLSQIRSFLFALLTITVVMMFTFRSVRYGLLSLIPNVWPIMLTLGFMGWKGIWLEPPTAMVAAVAIGIAVDDTIHFLNKYLEGRDRHESIDGAIHHALDISGRAIVFTTVILLAGFLVISTSEFKPYVNFGALTAMAIFLALLGDLLVMPAVLYAFPMKPRRTRRGAAASVAALFPLALLFAAPAEAETDALARGRAVVERVTAATRVATAEETRVAMVLRDKGGRSIEREAEIAFLREGEDRTRSLVRFLNPPDIRGMAFLSHAREGDDDRWLYLPALGRVKRIAASDQASSFAGTELAYEDLAGREVDDYTHRFLREDVLDGEPVEVVESIPTDPLSGYSRLESWAAKDKDAFLRVDYYDREGRLLKVSRVVEFHRPDGAQWRAKILVVENKQTGRATELRVKEQRLDAPLDPARFTVEALKAGS